MVKSYLRYEAGAVFGLVVSPAAHPAALFDTAHAPRRAIAAAGENVVTWDLKRGQQVTSWRGRKAEVTCIARSHGGRLVAVGYADGAIILWGTHDGAEGTAFQGHKGAVTALAFDADDARLASGARDTTVIVWDVVGERGLYRLHGHKDMVTACRFIKRADQLLTGSKDTLVKLWDLTTQHCVETLVAHRSEVWTLDVSENEQWLVTGSSDPELRLWRIDGELLGRQLETGAGADGHPARAITTLGTVPRQSTERAATVVFLPGGHFLACQALDKTVELFRVMDAQDAARKRQKKAAKKAKKAAIADDDGGKDDDDAVAPEAAELGAADLLLPFHTVRATSAKIRSIDVAANADATAFEILLALANNTIEVHTFVPGLRIKGSASAGTAAAAGTAPTTALQYTVEAPGHSSDVRTLALSSDDQLLCSGSNKGIKIWNMRNRTCIRTMDSGYALTSVFTPSNRHVVVGTKAGTLELYDIPSATCVATIEAHTAAVWSIALTADGRSLVSGSADHDVKFWDFELVEVTNADGQRSRQLTLVHTRTLRMADDVLAVVCSPDGKLLAISLLDATVKVFYIDTLKFFLSLYGHKLPVLSMDVTSDSTMLVTASADKSVKLWGLDFGDCHRSLLAHGDSVMAVRFVPNTHYFFSTSKDRLVKYWDGDKFETIMKLEGHHGEVWALTVSRLGDFVVSAGHDRSIRVWERTEEQLFLEEEREKELENLFEASLDDGGRRGARSAAADEEVDSAGRQTVETVKAGERIIEALDLAEEETAKLALHAQEQAANPAAKIAPPKPHPLLQATHSSTPAQYVLHVVAGISSADLEEALLVLPFSHILKLVTTVDEWFTRKWRVELACRVLFQLLQLHQDQIVAHRVFRPLLDTLRTKARQVLVEHRDMVGFNLAALQFLRRDWEAAASANLFAAPAALGSDLTVKRARLL